MLIAMSFQDQIVGYYRICKNYSVPAGYQATEYIDSLENRGVYAVWVLRQGLDLRFNHLYDKAHMEVLSKLNFYAANGVRGINGKAPYLWEPDLAKAALSHSQEMAEKDYFDHASYDGTKFSQRLLDFGIDWKACAENIDYGYTDPFAALNGWYNSQTGHRLNLLSDKYTRVGVGFAYSSVSSRRFFGTQDFYRGWDD
ncbi:MAG TPA: hypothetical protein DCG49_06400 [Ruminococcus sp.]|nr:hypothetical protein [Ruminococcus sp.]